MCWGGGTGVGGGARGKEAGEWGQDHRLPRGDPAMPPRPPAGEPRTEVRREDPYPTSDCCSRAAFRDAASSSAFFCFWYASSSVGDMAASLDSKAARSKSSLDRFNSAKKILSFSLMEGLEEMEPRSARSLPPPPVVGPVVNGEGGAACRASRRAVSRALSRWAGATTTASTCVALVPGAPAPDPDPVSPPAPPSPSPVPTSLRRSSSSSSFSSPPPRADSLWSAMGAPPRPPLLCTSAPAAEPDPELEAE